jgi:TrmH family RNA methyltransferase
LISRNDISLITSLAQKKYRDQHRLFVVEGAKMVEEAQRSSFVIRKLYETLTPVEMKKISYLKTPSGAIALVEQPIYRLDFPTLFHDLVLVLDGVQDPGNLGTIIRTADWFGIRHLVCSPDTADCYNPKTVQATMGAIFRVQVHYISLPAFLHEAAKTVPIYGATLDGDNIYAQKLVQQAVLVLGSEGRGISSEVSETLTSQLHIPSYPPLRSGSESLNVAASAAIACAEFRRHCLCLGDENTGAQKPQ